MTDNLDTLLQEQVAHAYANATAVRGIMEGAGVTPEDIKTPDDLAQVPVTSKEKLQEMQQENPPFGGFLGVPLSQLKRIYLSPGPIYDPHGFSEEISSSVTEQAFSEAGVTADDIVLNTFLYHMVPAGLLMDEALAQLGATVVPMGPGNTELQIKAIMDLGITTYVGTPSFLEMIYSKAGEMGITPEQIPLKKTFFSAEPYTPSQREKFEGEFGLVTSQAYATADLGVIGYERPGEQGLYIPDLLIVQICSPESGEILPDGDLGEVVVTTLNKAYPLIRLGTGDLSIMDRESDDSGKVRRKLRGWMGRSGEAIKVRGMFLHPSSIKQAHAAFPNISNIQAVIGRDGSRDTVTLHVILTEGDLDKESLKNAVQHTARLYIDEVTIVTEIEGRRAVRDTRTFE